MESLEFSIEKAVNCYIFKKKRMEGEDWKYESYIFQDWEDVIAHLTDAKF